MRYFLHKIHLTSFKAKASYSEAAIERSGWNKEQVAWSPNKTVTRPFSGSTIFTSLPNSLSRLISCVFGFTPSPPTPPPAPCLAHDRRRSSQKAVQSQYRASKIKGPICMSHKKYK